jgi:hypothetical protein
MNRYDCSRDSGMLLERYVIFLSSMSYFFLQVLDIMSFGVVLKMNGFGINE